MSLYNQLSLVCLGSFAGLCVFALFSVITLVRKRPGRPQRQPQGKERDEFASGSALGGRCHERRCSSFEPGCRPTWV